jgi:hypothetical protein
VSSAGRAAPTASAEKKICWDFVYALLELAIWLRAGEDSAGAIAAGSQTAGKKTGCRRLRRGGGRKKDPQPPEMVR